MGFGVWGLGFRVRVWGLGFRVWGLVFRVYGLRFRVQGAGPGSRCDLLRGVGRSRCASTVRIVQGKYCEVLPRVQEPAGTAVETVTAVDTVTAGDTVTAIEIILVGPLHYLGGTLKFVLAPQNTCTIAMWGWCGPLRGAARSK